MSSISKYKIILPGLMVIWLFLTPAQAALAADSTTGADSGVNQALGGLNVTANKGGIQSKTTDLPTLIGQVVGAVLAFVGVIFFCLILWAGFGWMLAKGNEQEITKAKDTIISSVLGLLVILGAYAITSLIASVFAP
jgi:hypothetical protein